MSAIRALRQVTAPLVARRTFTTATAVPRVAGMRVAALASTSRNTVARSFMSSATRFGQGSTDVVLSQKLQEELKYEKETSGADDEVPQFLKDFKDQGVWAIEDIAGNDEITLSRQFGTENIRLIFSIADIAPAEEDLAEEEADGAEPEETSYPIRASLSITKSNGPGALNVDMISQDGHFIVDNISFYDDAKVATELTADADWKRRGLYIGPQFETLDVAVQDEFEAFLQERGINDSIALFIPQYAEFKEQKEYVKWLGKVKTFVDL